MADVADAHDTGVSHVVDSYFRCVNEDDWDGLTKLLHEDATFVGVGSAPRTGAGAIVKSIERFMQLWATHHDEPCRVLVSGSTATVEIRFTGTTRAGKSVTFDALDVIDVEDGRVRSVRNWLDLDVIRRELGNA